MIKIFVPNATGKEEIVMAASIMESYNTHGMTTECTRAKRKFQIRITGPVKEIEEIGCRQA